jgi:peptide/nickel transport system ATP-binding protein
VIPLLEVRGLGKRFPGGLQALEEVTFSLGRGQSLGVVGHSGSGKSTLARLVARLADPSAGAIQLEGRDIGQVPAARFGRDPARRSIQLVFQSADDALNPAFSAARNIAIGRGSVRLDPTALAAVREVAAEVGLGPELLARRPHQLSGGQQARVGIARALISSPRLLILDEPTAALDVSVQAIVLKLIDRLRASRDIALLFVSHDLQVVRLMCDSVLMLEGGRARAWGPTAEVLGSLSEPAGC